MDFKKLADEAKQFVDDHGGTKALTEEGNELNGIVEGEGSIEDKLKEAADSVKEYAGQGPDGQPRQPAGQ